MNDAAAPPAVLEPTPEAERLHALDAMRGVAILGVLVAYTVWSLGNSPEESWTRADRFVARLVDVFVDNKFITMFACLFGAGIAQQWRRWEAAGVDPVPLHLRRMGFLLGVGLLHGALLRNGDILAPYAILGIVLLAFRRASNRTLAIASVLLVLAPYAINAAVAARGWSWPPRPGAVSGGYLVENLTWLRYWYTTLPLRDWPRILGVVLSGVLLLRSGTLDRLAASRALTGRVLVAALTVALITRLAYEWLGATSRMLPRGLWRGVSLHLIYLVSSWSLAAAYGTALMLIVRPGADPVPLPPLRAIGRMAFTNYLMQAVIAVPVCLALGLFDTFSPTGGLWFALAIALVQVIFSRWWLARFGVGPLERVWRGVTYGRGHVSLRPASRAPASTA